MAISEPHPVAVSGNGDDSNRALSPVRRRSPRSLTADSPVASISDSCTAAPTAIVNALLLNVPPWGSAFGPSGSYAAIS